MKRLRTFLYRLFVKRYLWSLPCKVGFGTKASPSIGQMVSETNPMGGWSHWLDEATFCYVALCYRRPSSGGLDGICWKQVSQ